jgi:hypothetical protein
MAKNEAELDEAKVRKLRAGYSQQGDLLSI